MDNRQHVLVSNLCLETDFLFSGRNILDESQRTQLNLNTTKELNSLTALKKLKSTQLKNALHHLFEEG